MYSCRDAGEVSRQPTLLTDDDVMDLLTFLFHGEAAQKKLDTLIEERRKTLTTDGREPLVLTRAQLYTT